MDNYEQIPEDVKQEMLKLWETCSKNELINKLRSLRGSPEKNLVQCGTDTNSKDFPNQHNFPETVNAINDALVNTHNKEQNYDNNISSQSKDNSLFLEINQHSHPVNNSDSFNSEENGTFDYDSIKSNPLFNPLVLLQKIDLTKINNEISGAPNFITEGKSQQDVGLYDSSTNKINGEKKKLVRTKTSKNISINASDKGLYKLEADKSVGKVSKISHKANRKSNNYLQKDNQSSKLEVTPLNEGSDIKSPNKKTTSASKKSILKKKVDTNVNMTVTDPSTADSNKNSAPDKNKNVGIEQPAKKKSVKSLRSNKIEESCDSMLPSPKEDHPNKELDFNSEINGIKEVKRKKINDHKKNVDTNITKKSRIKKPLQKNLKLISNADIEKQPTALSDNVTDEVNLCLSSKISPSNHIKVSKYADSENINSTELNFNEGATPTRARSLRKRKNNGRLSNSEIASNLEQNVLKNIAHSSDVEIKKQHSTFNVRNVDEGLVNKISLNDKVPVFVSPAVPMQSTSDDHVSVTKSASLKKMNNESLSKSETVSGLGENVLKRKTFSCSSAETKKGPSTFNFMNVDQDSVRKITSNGNKTVFVLPAISIQSTSADQVSVTNSTLLKKMSNESLPNSETVSSLKQNILKKKTSSCSNVGNVGECQNEDDTIKSNSTIVQNTEDSILTSKLREKLKASEEVKRCKSSDEMQQNAENYSKLSKLCSAHGLNLDDIFRRKEVQEMLEKFKNNTEAIVFLGTHKCQSTGKIEPTVHVHKSKKILLETLAAIQNKNGVQNPNSANDSILNKC
nr:putative uncharacterized protein DDB_G0282133 [Parasteatoda tepidariorum]